MSDAAQANPTATTEHVVAKIVNDLSSTWGVRGYELRIFKRQDNPELFVALEIETKHERIREMEMLPIHNFSPTHLHHILDARLLSLMVRVLDALIKEPPSCR